jgi:hypothetical protein
VILILASAENEAAAALARRWWESNARILAFADLSVAGWRYELPSTESLAVAAGKPVRSSEIAGVITMGSFVTLHDLPHIAVEDRAYAATEMQAFLVAWLHSLPCPVLNRPTPGCLCGPNWREGQWIRCAAQLGVPVVPLRRTSGVEPSFPPSAASVVVAGTHVVGDVDLRLAEHARGIARAAGVELLEVHFTGADANAAFTGVNLLPDLSHNAVADAVLDHLRAGRGGPEC